ncbi:hypothetical protein FRX31_015133 [Thalictrum thalictroides]|uniref:Uncharacterized protein n=1 Tax=Thalictrum thalictroides TaxID=46969 RepID=A0A7J6WE84_THATH|nr:hypothetical protein FRX31_015133 [Thalictrum thalictroides]
MHTLRHHARTQLANSISPPPLSSPADMSQLTTTMISLESVQANSRSMDTTSSPRISFSCDFLDEKNFISLSPSSETKKVLDTEKDKGCNIDFEFLSTDSATDTMLTADELFSEGKLLPFWQKQHVDRLNKINLKQKVEDEEEEKEASKEETNRVSWFIDEDPSPRPPKCTVLWKELLRLKKQRASSLSPSSSTSSSSSSSSDCNVQTASIDDGKGSKESIWNREKHVKRIKQTLERTRSASIRIRPVVNVPLSTQGKSSSGLPPLFSLRKRSVDR